jgi:hypothetical protein
MKDAKFDQLTRSRGHQKVCKSHPVKESLHLNRNPNQTDFGVGISVRQNLLPGWTDFVFN